jgi:hypothetical protein
MLMIAYSLEAVRRFLSERLKSRLAGIGAGEVAATAIFALLFVLLAITSRPVIGLDEGGNEAALAAGIASELEDSAVVLITPDIGSSLAPTLRYFEGVESASLTSYEGAAAPEFAELVEDLESGGRPVYLVWDNREPFALHDSLKAEKLSEPVFSIEILARSFEQRPAETVSGDWYLSLYRI